MICFVVLHYMVEKETIECITSIQKTIHQEKKIIVVDNASPNKSGESLKEKYKNSEDVIVLLNSDNVGFAKGNNLGYQFAKEQLQPDFIVVLNNDVEIQDCDFASKIQDVYKEEKFFVMGPDIYSDTYCLHQSPKRLKGYNKEEIQKLNQKYQRESKAGFCVYVKSFLKQNERIRKWIYQRRRKHIDHSKIYYNVPLHGACLIYSPLYIKENNEAFNPNTFFYYECEILNYKCKVEGYKTIYTPFLQVVHHQNVATNTVYKNMLKKTLFSNKCNYESTSAFLEYINECENHKLRKEPE